MNDWQAGYNGLMHPPGHNRNAFNAGIEARQQDQSMADMAARHHATMMAGSSSGSPAGPAIGVYVPGSGKIALWLALIFGAIILVYSGMNTAAERARESRREAGTVERRQEQQRADSEWGPALEQALRSYRPERDLDAIAAARALSPCYAQIIGAMIGGGTSVLHCRYTAPDRGPLRASLHYDRFIVEYYTRDPTIRHEAMVMALTPLTLQSGAALGRPSPVAVAIERLGRRLVESRTTRRCIVLAVDRHASNHDFNNGDPDLPRGVSVSSYQSLSTVSLACPSGKSGFALSASRSFRAN